MRPIPDAGTFRRMRPVPDAGTFRKMRCGPDISFFHHICSLHSDSLFFRLTSTVMKKGTPISDRISPAGSSYG